MAQYLVIASRGNECVVLAYCNIRNFCMVAPQGSQEAAIVAAPYLDEPIISTLTGKATQASTTDVKEHKRMYSTYIHPCIVCTYVCTYMILYAVR